MDTHDPARRHHRRAARDALHHRGHRLGRDRQRDPTRDATSERAELAHERCLGTPARDPRLGQDRDTPPPQAAVSVRRQPCDTLAVVRRDPVKVAGGPIKRHLARTAGGGDEDDVSISVGELSEWYPVDRHEAAVDYYVHMLAFDQLAGDLRERAELARLAAATDDLDAPPGYASAADAVARVLADGAGAASDQRQLRRRELPIPERAPPPDAVDDDADPQRPLRDAAARRHRQQQRDQHRPASTPTTHARSPTLRSARRRSRSGSRRRGRSRQPVGFAGRSATRSRRSRWPPTPRRQ